MVREKVKKSARPSGPMCNSRGTGLHHIALGFTFPNVTLYAVEERQQEYIRHGSIASLPHTQKQMLPAGAPS